MTFLNDLKTENNLKAGFNGELGYESTNSSLLDLYDIAGNSQFKEPQEIVDAIDKSYNDEPLLTAKLIAHGRDIRQGGGDKDLGRAGFYYLLKDIPVENVKKFVDIVAEYGSYKDVIYILFFSLHEYPHTKELVRVLDEQLEQDLVSDKPSLLAKYMPTETTNDMAMKEAYRKFMTYSSITPKEYRKRNTAIRKKLNIVETKLTEKDYKSIDYSHVPSQANLKYKNAFFRNDKERYEEYLKKVESGESKINAKTLAPYQIIEKVLWGFEDKTYDLLWDNLDKPNNNGLSALPVVDVSGSMTGLPMSVAISLGIILAENNEGDFKDHFITFSEKPKIHQLKGNTITEKAKFLERSDWGFETNLERVFDLVLNTAKRNGYTNKDIPECIIVFSDMNMDEATSEGTTFFDKMKKKYNDNGYDLPFLVFWNIGYGDVKPVTSTTKNTIMISGFSQNLFNSIFNLDLDDLENYTPLRALLETLESDRYKAVEGLYQTAD